LGERVAKQKEQEMTRHRLPLSPSGLSRRAALGSAGAIAALGLGSHFDRAIAQEATPAAMANHPMVGAWMASTPSGLAPGIFSPDGTVVVSVPATANSPLGTTYVSTSVGTWEPVSERGIHFTAVQLHSDANGTYVGSITVDGHPVVSEDGQSIVDDSPESGPTIRDAQGIVLDVLRGGPPVTGIRMGVGAPGFPEVSPTASTPTT
jgi:hypothetical protein